MSTFKYLIERYKDPNLQLQTLGLLLLFGSQVYAAVLLEGIEAYHMVITSFLLGGLMVLAPWRVAAILGALLVMTFIVDVIWGFQTSHLLNPIEVKAFLYKPAQTLFYLADIIDPNVAITAIYFILAANIGLFMSLRYRYTDYDLTYTGILAGLLAILVYAGMLGQSPASSTLTKIMYTLIP